MASLTFVDASAGVQREYCRTIARELRTLDTIFAAVDELVCSVIPSACNSVEQGKPPSPASCQAVSYLTSIRQELVAMSHESRAQALLLDVSRLCLCVGVAWGDMELVATSVGGCVRGLSHPSALINEGCSLLRCLDGSSESALMPLHEAVWIFVSVYRAFCEGDLRDCAQQQLKMDGAVDDLCALIAAEDLFGVTLYVERNFVRVPLLKQLLSMLARYVWARQWRAQGIGQAFRPQLAGSPTTVFDLPPVMLRGVFPSCA